METEDKKPASGKTCYVCKHEQRKEIEDAILAGTPFMQIQKLYKISRDSVRRHSKHFMGGAQQAIQRYDEVSLLARGGDIKAKFLIREADLLRIQARAERSGDLPTAISAIRELRQLHELQAKLTGQLRPQEVQVLAVNLDQKTSRRIAETYLQRHPQEQQAPQDDEQ